ncbi:MAG: peroxiredoxin [Luteolibacter sp.]
MKPEIGSSAPDFSAPLVGGSYRDGEMLTLSGLRGRPVVLVFYPKDSTPGCTMQACALRDGWEELREKAAIFGVSVDSEKSHRRFIDKHRLPYPLIADVDHGIVEAYGVWVQKSMFGKKYMGIERTTVVIGPDGKIRAILEKVSPTGHLEQLRETLDRS